MTTLPINLNPLAVEGHAFVPHRPSSNLTFHGPDIRHNPALEVEDAWAGLLVIGPTSQDESQFFSLQNVIDIVRDVRTAQVGDPSASFLTQKGIYRHQDGSGRIVEEDGVRVIVLNLAGSKASDFRKQMIELAETIAVKLNQETVILQMQHRGMTKKTFIVSA